MSLSRPVSVRVRLRIAAAGLAVAFAFGPSAAIAQQLGEGMVRSGTVGIQNDTERRLFSSLICTCGCPREALSTCTCGFAHDRRAELRAALAEGKSIDEIKAAYAERFGAHALAVPPNQGTHRAVWAVPLGAIVLGGGIVFVALRRWRRRQQEGTSEAGPVAGSPRDDYDDKLDAELKALDDE